MAVTSFYDALLLVGDYNISGDSNNVKIDAKSDPLEKTVFGMDTHQFVQGLESFEISIDGFVQYDDTPTPKLVDYQLNAKRGVEQIITAAPSTADGETAYFGRFIPDMDSRILSVSELGKFNWTSKVSNGRLTRGKVLAPLVQRSGASGTGVIRQLGAVLSTQKLYVAIHVTQFTGTTLTLNVFSNDTNDTTTPTSRASQAAITGVGSYWIEVAGPITDTYWYYTYTFTGTNFTAAVSAGIR